MKKMKQKEVAVAIGISPVAYNRFENNKIEPSMIILKRLSNFFDVDISDFFDYEIINNEIHLIKVQFRIYMKSLSKLYKKTQYLESLIIDYVDNKELEFIRTIDEIKHIYLDLQSEKYDLMKYIELEPYELFLDNIQKKASKKREKIDELNKRS